MDDIELLFNRIPNDVDVLGITEHRFTPNEVDSFTIQGSEISSMFCRSVNGAGGSLNMCKQNYCYESVDHISALSVEGEIEISITHFKNINLTCVCIY